MVYDATWLTIILSIIGFNLGVWACKKMFNSKQPYTFDTFWCLTAGFFSAVALFKWGW